MEAEKFLGLIPINPTLGFITLFVIVVIAFIIYTKITGNNNKQSNNFGSNNTFTNTNINQQTGNSTIDNKNENKP